MMKALTYTIAAILLLAPMGQFSPAQTTHTPIFDGDNAYTYLVEQCDFGPRPPGSLNLSLCRTYISFLFESFGWTVTLQNFTYMSTSCSNIIATWPETTNSTVILGAHYDTRPEASADPDPANRTKPILGANDGASGVAVLLELARVLPIENRPGVEIVLFDAEDSGNIDGWDWIQGSTYYVAQLNQTQREAISAMILVDIVGDADLYLPKESSSTDSLQNTVWDIAADLGYGTTFVGSYGGSILDDHRPFLNAGIPALDIIQIPFPEYWHTLEDTPDKCSGESLDKVGSVLEVFIVSESGGNYSPGIPYLLYGGILIIGVVLVLFCYVRSRRA
jgi:Zn-dependent M28 family amino/carboxypeptidase